MIDLFWADLNYLTRFWADGGASGARVAFFNQNPKRFEQKWRRGFLVRPAAPVFTRRTPFSECAPNICANYPGVIVSSPPSL